MYALSWDEILVNQWRLAFRISFFCEDSHLEHHRRNCWISELAGVVAAKLTRARPDTVVIFVYTVATFFCIPLRDCPATCSLPRTNALRARRRVRPPLFLQKPILFKFM